MDIASIACPSCNGNVESSSHIFFDCDFAKEIWRLIRSWCDFPLPTYRMVIGSLGSLHGMLLNRSRIVCTLSLWLLFGGFGGFVTVGHMSCSWVDWLKAPLLIAR
ncbi:RNA-directed DNA polymerase, eukaryota [Tanacetum coccineum]